MLKEYKENGSRNMHNKTFDNLTSSNSKHKLMGSFSGSKPTML